MSPVVPPMERHHHNSEFQRFLDSGAHSSEDVDQFLSGRTTPLVEGTSCTFLYRGQAEVVNLRHFIFGLPSVQPFHHLEGTDLWHLGIEIPPSSRIEYKLEVVQGGEGRWIEDPLNPLRARDPFGANSVIHGDGYEIPAWTHPDPEARPGTLEEVTLRSRHLSRNVRVLLYFPPLFLRTRSYPLLVVHDGGDYIEYSGAKTILDNLIHRMEIQEMVVAFTFPRDRMNEYVASEAHARFLAEELVPRLESRFPLFDRPAGRGLMGASLGAVASLHAARMRPEFFGRLLLQSGSFVFTDIGTHTGGPVIEPIVTFVNAYRDEPVPLAERVYVSCGIYESLIYENRSLVPVLQSTGMEVRYTEARDGHNWENWRDRLREGLSWLFPGPLWMVYE